MKTIPSLAISSAFLAFLGTSAHAAITYVDATDGTGGNTRATGELQSNTTWVGPNAASGNETQWNKRLFGNGVTTYQGWHAVTPSDPSTDTLPELTTRITGLASNTYDIWVFFWDSTGGNTWNISAGLASGALTTYSFDGQGNTTAPVDAETLSFTAPTILTRDGNGARTLYGVKLGQATVSGGSDVEVFVGNTGGGSGNRTWYDGVGFEVVPEPSTALLGGLGALLLLRRRR